MNKEIEEISDIISDYIEFCDVGGGSVSIDEDEVAKALYKAGYRKQSDDIARLNKEIERLKIQLEQANCGIVQCSGCELVRQNVIKEFAERLKAKLDEQKHFYEVAKIGYKDISLTALSTTYKMLDDLLKEYGVEI